MSFCRQGVTNLELAAALLTNSRLVWLWRWLPEITGLVRVEHCATVVRTCLRVRGGFLRRLQQR